MGKTGFKVRGTIRLGTGLRTATDFRKSIKAAGGYTGDPSDHILEDIAFTVSPKEAEVDLVIASVAEFGLGYRMRLRDIYSSILDLGYGLLSIEAGPQTLLQCGNQLRKGDVYHFAMEPVICPDYRHRIFTLAHDADGKLCLGGSGPSLYSPDTLFLFSRPSGFSHGTNPEGEIVL